MCHGDRDGKAGACGQRGSLIKNLVNCTVNIHGEACGQPRLIAGNSHGQGPLGDWAHSDLGLPTLIKLGVWVGVGLGLGSRVSLGL